MGLDTLSELGLLLNFHVVSEWTPEEIPGFV